MSNISGRTFLVTGGASGLGLACVVQFLELGGNVVILDISDPKQQDLFTAISHKYEGKYLFIETDVTSEESAQKAIDKSKQVFGNLYGLINCAGIGSAMRTITSKEPHDLDIFKRVININLIGTFNLCRLFAFAISKQQPDEKGERGVMINVASVAAYEGQIGQIAYSASKGGVVSMTIVLARDLQNYGIRVCTIAPGVFETPMLLALPDNKRKPLENSVTFPKRLGTPFEFAQLAVAIVGNRYLNGETIRLDGGIRMAAM